MIRKIDILIQFAGKTFQLLVQKGLHNISWLTRRNTKVSAALSITLFTLELIGNFISLSQIIWRTNWLRAKVTFALRTFYFVAIHIWD